MITVIIRSFMYEHFYTIRVQGSRFIQNKIFVLIMQLANNKGYEIFSYENLEHVVNVNGSTTLNAFKMKDSLFLIFGMHKYLF